MLLIRLAAEMECVAPNVSAGAGVVGEADAVTAYAVSATCLSNGGWGGVEWSEYVQAIVSDSSGRRK